MSLKNGYRLTVKDRFIRKPLRKDDKPRFMLPFFSAVFPSARDEIETGLIDMPENSFNGCF